MRKTVVLSFVLATVVALLPKVTLAADMFSGTWKSSNCVYQLELVNDVLHRVANCTNNPPIGNVHEEYIVEFDGKDSPMIAVQNGKSTAGLSASAKQIDDYTIEITLNSKGQYDHSQTWTVSKDGNTLTIEQISKNGRHSRGTFTKQ
jgi:hypothetical protein